MKEAALALTARKYFLWTNNAKLYSTCTVAPNRGAAFLFAEVFGARCGAVRVFACGLDNPTVRFGAVSSRGK